MVLKSVKDGAPGVIDMVGAGGEIWRSVEDRIGGWRVAEGGEGESCPDKVNDQCYDNVLEQAEEPNSWGPRRLPWGGRGGSAV